VTPDGQRQALFWIFIVVVGTCEASFAYNGFDTGVMRWLLIGLSVISLCLFALLDRTPPLRKAAIYVAAAVVWGGLRYGYFWVHDALKDADQTVFAILVWVDLLLNLASVIYLVRAWRRDPPKPQ